MQLEISVDVVSVGAILSIQHILRYTNLPVKTDAVPLYSPRERHVQTHCRLIRRRHGLTLASLAKVALEWSTRYNSYSTSITYSHSHTPVPVAAFCTPIYPPEGGVARRRCVVVYYPEPVPVYVPEYTNNGRNVVYIYIWPICKVS